MKRIAVLLIVMTVASIFAACASSQNTTASSAAQTNAPSSATSSESSPASSSASFLQTTSITTSSTMNSNSSTYSLPSTIGTTAGPASFLQTTSVQPATLSSLAAIWGASIGQYDKAYIYPVRTGLDTTTDYSIKIKSIKNIDNKIIRMEIVTGKQGITGDLDFTCLDKDGQEIRDRPASVTWSIVSIEIDAGAASSLASRMRFIMINGFSAAKNNGTTSIIFEILNPG